MKMSRRLVQFTLGVFCLILMLNLAGISQSTDPNIQDNFVASGYMGDGELEEGNYIIFNGAWEDRPHSPDDCIKIEYKFGPHRWGGIYWQNKADNFGDFPGVDLSNSNYSKVVFWVRGETGKEKIEFKSGGNFAPNKNFHDSYEVSIGRKTLSTSWEKYEIDLTGNDISSVIGAFCWIASKDYNSQKIITFYLDDINFQ